MRHIPEKVVERVLFNSVRDESTGCLVSRYSVGSHGYAQVGWHEDGQTRTVLCHRVSWVNSRGSIPDGMTVDHTCKNKRCIEPEHLRLISNFENARRTRGRDWPLGQCINGHPNSELRKVGSRTRCRVCKNDSQREYRERKRRADERAG